MQRFRFLVCVFTVCAALSARAGSLSKTLMAADVADHLSRLEQGIDLIGEFELSPNDVRKVATEVRAGAYDDFKKPNVSMSDDVTVQIDFGARKVKISFKTLERDELRVQGKLVNLKGSKTYANYSAEIDKILGIRGHKANQVTGLIATVAADIGYRLTNSSLRDFGGTKATSAASDGKTLAAEIIGFYRAQHARCVRGQHDGEREVGEFCSNEKFHPECLVAQQHTERACEAQIESYFVCGKEQKVAAAGTWDNDGKTFVRYTTKQPSVSALKSAFAPCCSQLGCYRSVRHDLVDLYKREPASGGAATPSADSAPAAAPSAATAMPNRVEPVLRDRTGFSHR